MSMLIYSRQSGEHVTMCSDLDEPLQEISELKEQFDCARNLQDRCQQLAVEEMITGKPWEATGSHGKPREG